MSVKLGHLHLGVLDLEGTIRELREVWGLEPAFRMDRMAVYDFGSGVTTVLDRVDDANDETQVTLAFEVPSCDEALAMLRERGARVLEEAVDQPWGVRTAYLLGPGRITLELEERLARGR